MDFIIKGRAPMNDLKTCPFCGKNFIREHRPHGQTSEGCLVCDWCGMEFHLRINFWGVSILEKVIEVFNRRPDDE
jgi:transcription elongation factor Elf1